MLFNDNNSQSIIEFEAKRLSLPTQYLATLGIVRASSSLRPLRSQKAMTRPECEKTIVEMYNENYSIDDIWRVSGFSSRSSVFRILNKYGVSLNRGRFSGPLGPRKAKE